MENQHIFDKLLEEGEELLYVIRPNKRRFVWANNIFSLVIGTIFIIPFFLIPVLGLVGVIRGNEGERWAFIPFLAFTSIFFLAIYSTPLYNRARYNKTFYGITNRRLLIQEGAISMSYRSYNLIDVSSIDVRIGFFDRKMKPETGSLYFYTVATTVAYNASSNNNRSGGPKACVFSAIEDPYSWYKKINDVKAEIKF